MIIEPSARTFMGQQFFFGSDAASSLSEHQWSWRMHVSDPSPKNIHELALL